MGGVRSSSVKAAVVAIQAPQVTTWLQRMTSHPSTHPTCRTHPQGCLTYPCTSSVCSGVPATQQSLDGAPSHQRAGARSPTSLAEKGMPHASEGMTPTMQATSWKPGPQRARAQQPAKPAPHLRGAAWRCTRGLHLSEGPQGQRGWRGGRAMGALTNVEASMGHGAAPRPCLPRARARGSVNGQRLRNRRRRRCPVAQDGQGCCGHATVLTAAALVAAAQGGVPCTKAGGWPWGDVADLGEGECEGEWSEEGGTAEGGCCGATNMTAYGCVCGWALWQGGVSVATTAGCHPHLYSAARAVVAKGPKPWDGAAAARPAPRTRATGSPWVSLTIAVFS